MKKLLLILLLLYPLSAAAETYQWVDESGTLNFAEDLGKVPKKYRKKAKKLGGEETTAPRSTPVTEPQTAKPQGDEPPSGKKVYGGKDENTWRRDFLQAASNLQNAESELATLNARLGDTSKMSRAEYLAIQNSIRHGETRVKAQQKKLDVLRETADRYGVPAELRQ